MDNLNPDGAAAPADDNALFADVISGAAPDIPADPPAAPASQAAAPAAPAIPAAPAATPAEPSIPPGRLREEMDGRRAAERERDELRGRLAAFERMQQTPRQPEAPRVDPMDRVLSDPTGLIREEAAQVFNPHLQAMHFNNRLIAESVRGGKEAVASAMVEYDRLETSGQLTPAEIQEVRQNPNPFVAAVDMLARRKTLAEVGGDLGAYRKRLLDEALKDPEHQKAVLAALRQGTQQNGQVVHRPALSGTPSLNSVGAAALPDNQADVSDAQLFANTTRRGRTASG